jgi:type IV secretory pathway VirB2 component (pilin)
MHRRSTSPSSRTAPARHPRRLPEAAEGVISTAIAVLIVAFLGIALWQGFELMMDSATQKTQDQVEQIGG